MSLYEKLDMADQAKAEGNYAAAKELEAHRDEILSGVNPEQEEAKRKVYARNIEEAVAAGNRRHAEEWRDRLQTLEDGIAARESELKQIDADLASLSQERQKIAREVYVEGTAGLHDLVLAEIEKLCAYLEDIDQGITQFSDTHKLEISRVRIEQILKVSSIGGPERFLFKRMQDVHLRD
jgi:seryl-tRNA synthetase